MRFLMVFVVGCALVHADKASIVVMDPTPKIVSGVTAFVKPETGTIVSRGEARGLIEEVLRNGSTRAGGVSTLGVDDAGFYCVIHTVVFDKTTSEVPSPGGGKQAPQKVKEQHWYLYNGSAKWTVEQFTTKKRIYGARKLSILYVYLDKWTDAAFQPRYEVEIASKEPANVQHLFALAGAFLPSELKSAKAAANVANYAGIASFDVRYVPSDISITPFVRQGDTDSSGGSLDTGIGDSIVFDNEGRYYWDASVGVPLRKMGQLEFVNANNTIVAKEPDKRTAFALLDLYPFAKDVKEQGFDWRPYAVAGVGIGKQPLHRVLVGVGWGPKFAQFYAGVLFVREQELQGLSAGASATPAQQAAATDYRYHQKFAFGINVPVRDVFKAATGGKSGSSAAGMNNQ